MVSPQVLGQEEDLIAQLPGCEMARALAIVTLHMMSYMISNAQRPVCLFEGEQRKYIVLCNDSDWIEGTNVVVGVVQTGCPMIEVLQQRAAPCLGLGIVPMRKF
jgi:hypothetical protein